MNSCLDCGTEDITIVWHPNHAKVTCECGGEYYIFRSRSSTKKDIPAHWQHFPEFFLLMLAEMDLHHEEKGDSWLDSDTIPYHVPELVDVPTQKHLVGSFEDVFHRFMKKNEPVELEDIANFCSMIRMRGLVRGSVSTTSKGGE